MNAADVLNMAKAAGVRLYVDDGQIVATPRAAITDELRRLIRAHKPALLKALQPASEALVADVAQFPEEGAPTPQPSSAPLSSAAEARRKRVIAMLNANPGRYALVVDEADPAYPGCVVLAVGIRGDAGDISTCDLIVPEDRYDGFVLLDLIRRQGGIVH